MSGFQHASVSKGMMMGLGIGSLAVSLMELKPYFHLQLVPHMTKYHQFWRILIHPFIFANSTELVVAELLLYSVGVRIERSFGPRKYASFVIVSSIVSTLLSLAVLILLHGFGLKSVPAGPYGMIFSLLWQYYRVVPTVYTFKLFGLELSDKSMTWIQAGVLFASSIPSSILASSIGLLTGYLYRTDTLILIPTLRHRRLIRPLKTYRIPLSLYTLISRLLSPLVGNSQPPRRQGRMLPGQITPNPRSSEPTTASLIAGILAERPQPGIPPPGSLGVPGTITGLAPGAAIGRSAPGASRRPVPLPVPRRSETNQDEGTGDGRPETARAAVGEWVSELTGRGSNTTRAPTEVEIDTLSSMFPNFSRERIVTALQRNDHNTAQAVEALLQETT